MGDFLSDYINYASEATPEVPAIFSRWACLAGIGALLGRQYYFEHGAFTIHSNLYCMLVGSVGTRKSTAVKLFKKLLSQTGYSTFAAEKTSKEKFLLDLAGEDSGNTSVDNILEQNLFGDSDGKTDSEMFITADEFNDFTGDGNIEFISLLGSLWDFSGDYPVRFKNSKSFTIHNPTISILAGNTPTNISRAFPPEVLGQGFFSRLIFIYGEPNGKRVTFPDPPSADTNRKFIECLKIIKSRVLGSAKLTTEAKETIDGIYQSNPTIADVRFAGYSNRRLNQLIKLCLIVSASRYATEITFDDVIYANTILSYAEQFMPKALGEFGRARNSDVSHKVLEIIDNGPGVITFKTIWREVCSDLDKFEDLHSILRKLVEADKIQMVELTEIKGFLPKRSLSLENKIKNKKNECWVDFNLLTEDERKFV